MKGVSLASVGADMQVNTLMGYRKRFRASEPIRNLLGAPLMTHFTFDQTTATPRSFEGTTAHRRTALLGALMGCLRKITVRAFSVSIRARSLCGLHRLRAQSAWDPVQLCIMPIFRIFEAGPAEYILS